MRYNAQEIFVKQIYHHIASNLKNLRKQRGWSLDKTAQETGVSKAMLGQIEREESSPTIATLWKIASGFNTPFSSFIEEIQTPQNQPVHRFGKTQPLHPAEENIRVLSLFPFDPMLQFEIFTIELLPGCEHLSSPHEIGVIEHVMVAQGTMEVLVNKAWQTLKQGEGLRFNADQAHGYRNLNNSIAQFYNVIYYPA